MQAEVEAKFVADDRSALDALAVVPTLAFADLGPAHSVAESDRYLDTRDGALGAAGWACRLREREGSIRVSLKGPAEATAGDWHHRRPEIEGPATASVDPADWPDSEARARVVELSGGAPLVERLTLGQERTERRVDAGGEAVATLSLDVVTILDDGLDRGTMLIVELELVEADALSDARFETLAAALGTRDGLRPDPRTKLQHALSRLAAR